MNRIAVLGAGLIGTYVGAALHAAGAEVTLIGRGWMREQVESAPLVLTDLNGGRTELSAGALDFREDYDALAAAGLVLVAVKSADTRAAADLIAGTKGRPVVLSLQNGVGNQDVLAAALPDADVAGGLVGFNVARPEPGRLHRATDGTVMAAATPGLAPWLHRFAAAGLPVDQRADFIGVQWGKLLFNLNNAVNALAGLPLRTQLAQRAYRRSFALLAAETLSVLKAAGITPVRVSKVPPQALPTLLRVPDAVFTRAAGAMFRIDPEARSSMWEDLAAGRKTEVDYLNGAVVRLAASAGRPAPANQAVVELVHAAEASGSPQLSADELYRRLSPRQKAS
jgi:2-dehydropantoate 2-reductase